MEQVPAQAERRYLLMISFGAAVNIDIHNGDGAYFHWMTEYFGAPGTASRALIAEGFHAFAAQTLKQPDNTARFNAAVRSTVEALITKSSGVMGRVLVVNWHLRITGRTNAWTGYGITPALVQAVKAQCVASAVECKFVLTVHEYGGEDQIKDVFPHLDGVIALDLKVREQLATLLKTKVKVIHLSNLPNFMRTQSAEAADAFRQGLELDVEAFLSTKDNKAAIEDREGAAASSTSAGQGGATQFGYDLATGYWIAKLKSLTRYAHLGNPNSKPEIDAINANRSSSSALKGVLIFGTLCGRHFNEVHLASLAQAVLEKFGKDFKIVIAGNPKGGPLKDSVTAASDRYGNVELIGKVDTLDCLPAVKYAISFDKDGYRNNASAMINVIRAGFLLFARRMADENRFITGISGKDETDANLIQRAVGVMEKCEGAGGDNRRYHYLAAQQGRSKRATVDKVGPGLDAIFHSIAFPGAVLAHPRGVLGTVLPETVSDDGLADESMVDVGTALVPELNEEDDDVPIGDDSGLTSQQRENSRYGYNVQSRDSEDEDEYRMDSEEEDSGYQQALRLADSKERLPVVHPSGVGTKQPRTAGGGAKDEQPPNKKQK